MNSTDLKYLGPLPKVLSRIDEKSILRRLPWAFFVVVVFPTLLAALYYLVLAAPRYVSEARFVVRSASGGGTPSAFGVALQGVGIAPAQTEAFAVHEYVNSLDAARDLKRRFNLSAVLSPPGSDFLYRYPRPWESRSDEGLKNALRRFVTIGYDSTTSISTLRVEAFSPADARRVASALLDGGESVVNQLNERSLSDAVVQGRLNQEQAQARLVQAQADLTSFRNRERMIDPVRTATESSQLLGEMMAQLAQLRAERDQIATDAPSSPQIRSFDSRIAAYERQLAAERARMAGSSGSLAPSIGVYERLTLSRDLAAQELAQTTAALLAAQQDTRRQKLYLERIVQPTLPDVALRPRRLLSVLIVLGSCLLAYSVGWLLWAGVREHRQY